MFDHNASAVINLNTFSGRDEFPAYCAVFSKTQNINETLFALTPDVMRWSEDTWLFHMEPCKSYWQQKTRSTQMSLESIFHQLFCHSFDEGYLCVFANHPWQALFFLTALKRRQARGIYFLNSLLNQRVYKHLAWQDWFEPMQVLSEHLVTLKSPGFVASQFRSKQNQLKRFIARMGLRGPFELGQADAASVARRFSSLLGKIWKWTFYGFSNHDKEKTLDLFSWSAQQADLRGFPWVSFEIAPPPKVLRHLEYPISSWDVVEPLLKADLQKLCALKNWSQFEKVLSLHWDIMLYNFEKVTVEVSFRHPHALHEELELGFKTALYQAQYSYMDLMNQLKSRDTDLDLPEVMPFLSWEVTIAKRIYQSSQILQLMPLNQNGMEYEKISSLQNKLSVPLEHYQVQPDFLPETSYGGVAVGARTVKDFSIEQWIFAACKRPLFFYKQPQPLEENFFKRFRFLERVCNNWWQQQNLLQFQRDYFVLEYKEQWIWAYKDASGRWFQHGLYS